MKVIARELVWLFIALMLSMPVGYIFGSLLGLRPENEELTSLEEVFEMEVFLIGAIIGFVLTYIMRVFMWAITKFALSERK
jgi:hypothetical protein